MEARLKGLSSGETRTTSVSGRTELVIFIEEDKPKEWVAKVGVYLSAILPVHIQVCFITDNSDRAFYKELVKVIEASDVILEVFDARDPLGTRCVDMKKMVLKARPDKHLVLLLNKIVIIPRESAEKWLAYLREELSTIAFKCNTQQQKSN